MVQFRRARLGLQSAKFGPGICCSARHGHVPHPNKFILAIQTGVAGIAILRRARFGELFLAGTTAIRGIVWSVSELEYLPTSPTITHVQYDFSGDDVVKADWRANSFRGRREPDWISNTPCWPDYRYMLYSRPVQRVRLSEAAARGRGVVHHDEDAARLEIVEHGLVEGFHVG